MAGELSRVTVVGERKRVDVAVPAATPIGEYVARLARLCGQDRDPVRPPAWSLAIAGAPPYPPTASLAELGVFDGQVLYLRDATSEPSEPPAVEDIDELVANEGPDLRRRLVRPGTAVCGLGLLWTAGSAAWLGASVPGTAAAVCLAVTGLALIGLAWALGQRSVRVSGGIRLATALTALPCLGVAGMVAGLQLAGAGGRWPGFATGTAVAAATALAALPDVALAVVAVQATLTAVVLLLLGYAGGNRFDNAACAVLVASGFLAITRRLAASIAAWAASTTRTRPGAAAAAKELVHASGKLLTLLVLAPGVALAVTLPVLALSGRWFALALATAVSAGLLGRARLAGFTGELVILAVAGLAGVFAVAVAVAGQLRLAPLAGTLLFLLCSLGLLATGAGLLVYGRVDPGQPNDSRPPRRRTRAEVVTTVSSVLAGPLALGVFGVLGHLLSVGRNLF